MAITPFRPTFDPFTRIFDLMMGPQGGHAGAEMIRSPETDVVETEDGIDVVMEMPGMSPENIQIELENNVLTVTAEKQEEREEEKGTYHLAERRFGRFSRSFVLPRSVESDQIEARFENGVLRIHVPKSERSRRRRIEVGAGAGTTGQARDIGVQGGGRGGAEGGASRTGGQGEAAAAAPGRQGSASAPGAGQNRGGSSAGGAGGRGVKT